MKAKPALTTCTVTARACSGTYVGRVEDNGITASCTMGAEFAARAAAGHALRVAPERVVLTSIPSATHGRVRYTATIEETQP
jgi:hypothetical protein